MPIRAFVDGHSAFDPETIQNMSRALADALTALGLVGKSDDLTLVVAQKIIDLATAGEHDAARLAAAVLKSLRQ